MASSETTLAIWDGQGVVCLAMLIPPGLQLHAVWWYRLSSTIPTRVIDVTLDSDMIMALDSEGNVWDLPYDRTSRGVRPHLKGNAKMDSRPKEQSRTAERITLPDGQAFVYSICARQSHRAVLALGPVQLHGVNEREGGRRVKVEISRQ